MPSTWSPSAYKVSIFKLLCVRVCRQLHINKTPLNDLDWSSLGTLIFSKVISGDFCNLCYQKQLVGPSQSEPFSIHLPHCLPPPSQVVAAGWKSHCIICRWVTNATVAKVSRSINKFLISLKIDIVARVQCYIFTTLRVKCAFINWSGSLSISSLSISKLPQQGSTLMCHSHTGFSSKESFYSEKPSGL